MSLMSRSRLAASALVLATAAACTDHAASTALGPQTQPRLASGSGSGTKVIDLRDDCDSVSFNAELGAGTCIRRGSVTFDEFLAELREKRDVGSWKNNPDRFDAKLGTLLDVVNIGGEGHSFTRVVRFGGGFVPLLNTLSGNTTVAPECANPATVTVVPAGGHQHIRTGGTGLAAGTYRFQCCIHPWMRTTATIKRS